VPPAPAARAGPQGPRSPADPCPTLCGGDATRKLIRAEALHPNRKPQPAAPRQDRRRPEPATRSADRCLLTAAGWPPAAVSNRTVPPRTGWFGAVSRPSMVLPARPGLRKGGNVMRAGRDRARHVLIAARTWPRRSHVPKHAAPRQSSASRYRIQIIWSAIVVVAAATVIVALTRSNWTRRCTGRRARQPTLFRCGSPLACGRSDQSRRQGGMAGFDLTWRFLGDDGVNWWHSIDNPARRGRVGRDDHQPGSHRR